MKIFTLSVLTLGVCLAGCQATKAKEASDAVPPAQVQAGSVVQRMDPLQIRAQASVVPDPQHVSRVASTEAQSVLAVDVRVGDKVQKGQVLLELAEDPQVIAADQQAQIQLAAAKREMQREESLVKGGVAPRLDADQAQTQYGVASAQAADAKAQLDRMEANTRLRAPMSGVVVAVSASVGQVTTPGADLVEIADPNQLMAQLQIEPQYFSQVRSGQIAWLQIPGASGSFQARLTRVSAALNPTTQLAEADAELLPGHPKLGIGRFLTARVSVGSENDLLVPAGALVHRDDGDKVYVVSGSTAQEVPVERLSRFGKWVAVKGKLSPGLHVVTTGCYELSDGEAIAIASSSASR